MGLTKNNCVLSGKVKISDLDTNDCLSSSTNVEKPIIDEKSTKVDEKPIKANRKPRRLNKKLRDI